VAFGLLLTLVMGAPGAADGAPAGTDVRLLQVRAEADRLVLTARMDHPGDVRLLELRPCETRPAGRVIAADWRAVPAGFQTALPRRAGSRDRLFSRFQLVDAKRPAARGPARWVENVESLAVRHFPLPTPRGLKGLQCIADVDDALRLGVKQATQNVPLDLLVDGGRNPRNPCREVDGERIFFNRWFVARLDEQITKLSRAGVVNYLVIYNRVPRRPDPANPLIHPRTDLAAAPNQIGAFNLTDERGLRVFRGALAFLADRYTDPAGTHGRVNGLIIGNELQSHWFWYNLGEAAPGEVVARYLPALRVAHLAVRSIHPGLRIYLSLDHHWTARATDNPRRSMAGREFLERLNARARAEGNFPWHVAFHAYPEQLINPRTWADHEARADFATPKITFKNIEVLPAFLRQERFLYQGRPRRVILSEQGFHALPGREGEQLQAAGFAYACRRLHGLSGIDAFILYRHTDSGGEGGLRFGLRERGTGGQRLGRKRRLYDVFRLADTDRWEAAFRFALPIIGIRNWAEIRPAPLGNAARHAPPPVP
jgi:hypothetical protein